ncbi:MAG: hypothetical protein J5I98_32175 [Phaeodactylibacter sp.]|nr:hypothetical protein [Phaeodactylibacter sp.]
MNITILEPFVSGSHQKWAGGYQAPHRLACPEHIPEKEHHRHLYENEEDFYAKLRDVALY